MNDQHRQFWQAYLATLPEDHPHHKATFGAWGFGDSPEMAEELAQLVRDGIKQATASLAKAYEIEGEQIPPVGDISMILNGKDEPVCIIETTEITLKPFNQVDAQFAYDEGEDDRTLNSWTEGHRRFFTRECESLGIVFDEEMLVVCERFKLIYK